MKSLKSYPMKIKREPLQMQKWQKAIMVAGGPLSNFILAFVIFFLSFTFFGSQGTVAKIDQIIFQIIFLHNIH